VAFLERLKRKIDRIQLRTRCVADAWFLFLINRVSSSVVSGNIGPVVSLTTYGARLDGAYLTIESIARGSMKPSRIILWLDDKFRASDLPHSLARLQQRGLEIRFTKDYGPHTKYYPYLLQEMSGDIPLVTADDDILYPRRWLEKLWNAYEADPTVIHCHRARLINVDAAGNLANYASWELCKSTTASYCHFGTGVSGVIYPAAVLEALRAAGDTFLEVCPKADDVWLHVQALRAGFKVRQISSRAAHFPVLEMTQATSLQMQNHIGGRNDVQIRATYNEADLTLIRSAKRP
jgi:hypothetical protein